MITFLLLLFPLALTLYCCWTKEKKDIVPIFCGIMSAVVVCAFKVFFTYSHRIVPFSFSENFIYYLFRLSIFPVCVLYLFFFLIVKDTKEYKVKLFFPLISGFYTIYMPYYIISSSSAIYSGYDLFLRPLLYLSLVCLAAISLHYLRKSILDKNYLFIAISGLLLILALLVPAISDALYAINYNFSLIILIDVFYLVLPGLYLLMVFIFSLSNKMLSDKESAQESE